VVQIDFSVILKFTNTIFIIILMNHKVQFNNTVVDLVSRELFVDGQLIHLQKKSFDLLLYLIENRERAVSKDELLDKLWDRNFASENVLAHASSKLRSALNDNHKQGKIIRTIHGFGLQFVAKIDSNNNLIENYSRIFLLKIFFGLIVIFSIGFYFYQQSTKNSLETDSIKITKNAQLINSAKIHFIIENPQYLENHWKINGLTTYFNQLLSYSDNSLPINFIQSSQDKTFIDNRQLDIKNVIYAKQEQNILYLTYKENNIVRSEFNVVMDDLSTAVFKVNNWMCHHTLIENSLCEKNFKPLAHNDSFIVENYIRGQNALENQQIKEAKNFFEICLQQDADFILSRIALAHTEYRLSNYNAAIAQSLSAIKTSNNDLVIFQAQLLLGQSYYRTSQPDKAKSIFNQIIDNKNVNTIPKGLALLEITKIDKDNLELDAAIIKAQQAIIIFQELDLPQKIALSNDLLGDIYLTKGELSLAQEYLTKALKIYETINDNIGIHSASASLGTIYRRLGNYNASYEYAKQRLDIANKIKDPINIIGAHSQIAYSLIELGKLEKALEHASLMTQLALNENEINTLYFAYALEGEIANSMKNYTLALDKNKQALTIAKELKQNKKQIETLCFMGSIATSNKQFLEAEAYLDNCHQLAIVHDYLLFKAVSQLYSASLNKENGQLKKAQVFLEKSLEHANKIDHPKLYNEIYMEYFYIYINTDVEAAEKYLEKIPESYKENYPYLISSAEISYHRKSYKKALELALQAKQFAKEMWLSENQELLEKILVKVKNHE
jgi:DNA-binding winged helix-turn-helix (wHTH) protein